MACYLYIPHGSDERVTRRKKTMKKSLFISHMVQMKDETWRDGHQERNSPLYPTWFRWKACDSFFKRFAFSLYIPHGSDERNKILTNLYNELELYIPHGSDESTYLLCLVRYFQTLYIPHGSDERGGRSRHSLLSFFSLYPTWFRWKFISFLILSGWLGFISHMVQMKVVGNPILSRYW